MVYEKLPITFWQTHPNEVTLSLVNDKGETIWSEKVSARRGFNAYRWDLVVKHNSSALPYFLTFREYVKKGRYKLRLAGRTTVETVLDIVD